MPVTPDTGAVTSAAERLTLLHGSDQPLPAPAVLRAGHVTAALDGVDLRYLRVGQVELVRRIYVAVGDRDRLNEETVQLATGEVTIEGGNW